MSRMDKYLSAKGKILKKLEKDLIKNQKSLENIDKKLSSQGFLAKADPELIKKTKKHRKVLAFEIEAAKKTLKNPGMGPTLRLNLFIPFPDDLKGKM